MVNIDYQSMIKVISQIIWPIGRFTGLFLAAPFFSSPLIPSRIKVVFIFLLSWICAFMVPAELSFEHFNGLYAVYMVQEIIFGILMGFVLQLVFQVFVLVGQIISMQAGLGFAVMVDPMSSASVPLISQYYNLMVMLVFLALGGHVALLEAVMNSFKIMPIGSLYMENAMVWKIIIFSGWMFKEAVLITIPAIISLLLISLSIGIVTRVAPQLNIFSLGFPITLMMAIAIIQITLPSVGEQMVESLEQGMHFIIGLLH
ncbi:flagellar biosynthetic protein FliR [Legionella sp. km772]|uniref:flagellar biosynthetic protein FliR n=1 Tax=Legionella sp. km772 TaxID=2498111 RepID=UPI000F8D3913|nr:flagellar biosynthetic protein FliR [Legionella sp. km772]RUR08335.1 flagellar biosynthetic protein FliR [Legionella sp. km772]